MPRPHEDDMTSLDRVVYDPRFAPYYGWHDDHRPAHFAGSGYLAAMWQVRSEFHAFAYMLAERGINGRCLQLGLGFCASHMVFKKLFKDVWTVELDAYSHIDTLIIGSTHDPDVQDKVRKSGKFDLLFIDADHTIDAVRADFNDYLPMVRADGVIAFHDAFPQREDNGVWCFLNELRANGHPIHVIGEEIGIAWMTV